MNTLFGRSRIALTRGSPAMKAQLNQQGGVPIAGTKTRLANRASGVAALFLFALGVVGFALSAPAFAVKDNLYVSNVDAVNVGGAPVTSSSTLAGGNRQVTITNPIVGARTVSVQVTWAIDHSATTTTTYPKNGIGFSGSTAPGDTDVGAISVSPTTCDFTAHTNTCSSTITFTTPNVNDEIQVKIAPTNTGSGNTELLGKFLFINFTVVEEAAVTKVDTTLTVPDPQCFLYGAGEVGLTATLTAQADGNPPISGRQVDFKVDGSPIGSDLTDNDGNAVLTYNVSGLAAGDYNLYAEFLGDTDYNGSNDSATLGVSYAFVGFQQPINADGTSVFGNGRIIPVKIKLTGANLQPVTDAAPTVWMTQVSPLTALGTDLVEAASVSAADVGNTMRYVPEDDQYIFNWDLSSLANGTWYVVVDLGDSAACSHGPYYATITVSKKGKK